MKLKVVKFSNGRKILEIPKSVRDNFKIGEKMIVSLYSKRKKKKRKKR